MRTLVAWVGFPFVWGAFMWGGSLLLDGTTGTEAVVVVVAAFMAAIFVMAKVLGTPPNQR